jgi:hypothetical protein
MLFESEPYRVSRTDLARIASLEYLRTFWWVVIGIPLFGVIALIWGQGLLQVIGMFALLWPFSIPARSILTTTKASKLFAGGVQLVVFEDRLEFRGQALGKSGKPLRMVVPLDTVRDLVLRGRFYLVRTIRLEIAPVPFDAVTNLTGWDAFRLALDENKEEHTERKDVPGYHS